MTKFAGWMGSGLQKDESIALLGQMTAADSTFSVRHGESYALSTCASDITQLNGAVLLIPQSGSRTGRSKSLLEVYLNRGVDFLVGLPEADTLVLIDTDRRRLILATDPIGLSNIYYAEIAGGLIYGSSADFIVRHPHVSNAIAPQAVFDYIYLNHCPSPSTIYRQVKKLEGGQCLVYQNGRVSLKHYWLPVFVEQSCDLQQAGRELQQELIDAVRSMADNEDNTGAFLSGGLDSSSVAGALAKVFPDKAKTFSMGFDADGYDEIEYANIAVQRFNTRQHQYYVTPEDTVNAVPAIAAYYDEPFGNASALAAYYCAKLAKENGVNRLLAGDGGDEIFAGNERYAKQMLFENYHRLPKFLGAGLEATLNALPAVIAKQKLPFKAKRYIDQANAAMPDRLQDYNFLHRHAAADIFQADFLAQIDTAAPLRQFREDYWRPESASTLNRMLYLDWKNTLHDNDLVKVNRMCEMAGVEVCYPLLNRRILDLSCRIPSNDKLRGQKLRWFYKQAMTDFLPERIINKPKHGFGLPFGVWLKDHQPLKQLAYGTINDLKRREFFKSDFLDHAIEMHQSVHAAYYGDLVWMLMMLEFWFVGKGL
jgi:asparagine synthase (glutamine-hydrolysing)